MKTMTHETGVYLLPVTLHWYQRLDIKSFWTLQLQKEALQLILSVSRWLIMKSLNYGYLHKHKIRKKCIWIALPFTVGAFLKKFISKMICVI